MVIRLSFSTPFDTVLPSSRDLSVEEPSSINSAVGTRLGLSEALLGMLAALAADAPEITAAVTALVRHDQRVGDGVPE